MLINTCRKILENIEKVKTIPFEKRKLNQLRKPRATQNPKNLIVNQ